MFNYATYNGVPIITYGLIGLTASILGLITFNPSILELKENGEQTTIADAIGLDKISMPELPAFVGPNASEDSSTSYLPGLNGMPQPFSSDETKDDDESDDESDDDEPISEQSSVMNPLRGQREGGRKTRNKRKNKRKTKRKK
jgi:hypothetical protein